MSVNYLSPIPRIANHYSQLTDEKGYVMYGKFDTASTPSTTANIFQKGCIMVKTDATTGVKACYENVGTLAAPSWDLLGQISTSDIANGAVTGAKLVTTFGMASIARQTNGTTPVNVFGATLPFSGTVDGIFVCSNDTTAGNITISNNGNVVATIAKGTSAGVLTGATSLANTSMVAGTPFTIVSDSAGNVTCYITFRFN